MDEKIAFALLLLHCPLWLLIAATVYGLVLEMTHAEIVAMLGPSVCMCLVAAMHFVVSWSPTLHLSLSLIQHLAFAIWVCRLVPQQRTAKAEFSARLGIPATDARVADAFSFLTAYGRREVKTAEDLDALLKRSESEQKERAENALFRRRDFN
jgi:hypothetical protein